jgi:hypothetical protein
VMGLCFVSSRETQVLVSYVHNHLDSVSLGFSFRTAQGFTRTLFCGVEIFKWSEFEFEPEKYAFSLSSLF